MNRSNNYLSVVVDDVLASANAAVQRRNGEAQAIKVAAAQPKTQMARDLRALAGDVRSMSDDVSYADFTGAP